MKLLIYSDLHLENSAFEPDPDAVRAADVVVLAGDIHPGSDGVIWARQTFPDKPVVTSRRACPPRFKCRNDLSTAYR